MISLLILVVVVVLLAVLAYKLCEHFGLPQIVAIVAALLVLLAGLGYYSGSGPY